MTIHRSITAAAAASVIALAGVTMALPAFSQDGKPRHTADEIAKAKPSGTLELEAEQVRLILGGSAGRGTLFYKGKSYPFTMKGGTVGGVGITKVSATGTVYFLDKLEDFPGMYSAATAGIAVGGGVGASQFENNKGVFVSVRSKTEGVALNMGLGAVQIAFVK